MSTTHIIQSILEICLISFVLWGLFNEDIIADYEKKLFNKLKPHLKSIKNWIKGE